MINKERGTQPLVCEQERKYRGQMKRKKRSQENSSKLNSSGSQN